MLFFLILLYSGIFQPAHQNPHPDAIKSHLRRGKLYKNALNELKNQHYLMLKRDNLYSKTRWDYWNSPIDHQNLTIGSFKQIYVEDTTYSSSDIAILYIEGEGPIQPPMGTVMNLARNLSARVVTLEHRFYGQSMPYPLTYKEGLKYLNVEQAMKDFAEFTLWYNQNIAKKSLRWIVMGGSYAGALSVWLRQTYPTLFLAAWSSSGVVNSILNFYQYDLHSKYVTSDQCHSKLSSLIQKGSDLWISKKSKFMKLFNLTLHFSKKDIEYMISDSIAASVQYGMKTDLCHTVNIDNSLQSLYDFLSSAFGNDFANSCTYSTECLTNKKYHKLWPLNGYSWIYQTCSQLGWFQIGFINSIRSSNFTLDYFINQCKKAFYNTTYPDTYKFNKKYGGSNPTTKGTSRVIAFQGSDDPWITAGVSHTLSSTYIEHTAVCDNCGHCGDLNFSNRPEIVTQQQMGITYLNLWLNKPQ